MKRIKRNPEKYVPLVHGMPKDYKSYKFSLWRFSLNPNSEFNAIEHAGEKNSLATFLLMGKKSRNCGFKYLIRSEFNKWNDSPAHGPNGLASVQYKIVPIWAYSK